MDADAESDDERRLIFAELDNKLLSNTDMALGQPLAESDDQIRDHRSFDCPEDRRSREATAADALTA